MDRFSPVAPARIRVQVLPVGRIERNRFNTVLKALAQHAAVVKLGDIDTQDSENLLSPTRYPQGSLFFSYTSSPPSDNEQQLPPFELFREPQLVLGIVGALSGEEEDDRKAELVRAAEHLREHYPRVIHRHMVLLPEAEGGTAADLDNITRIAKSDDDESGLALRDAICEVAGHFLADLSIYAKAIQASPTIQTPSQKSNRPRTWSIRSDDDRAGSGTATPTQTTELSSPVADDPSRPPSRSMRSPPPPTSFDQMRSAANTVPSALARSDSRTSSHGRQQSGRPSSQDRARGSQHKARDRGKARVGIVLGHIYMMAGQWNEALRILVEHTNAARKLSDNVWHAKGLEGIVVCMLLLSWAGLEFSIPSICYPISERSHSAHVQKLSVNLPSDFRPADAAHQASVRRLSTSLPDLLKQILSLYETGEGSLKLPVLMLCEVKIRFCMLMATLYHSSNELSGLTLTAIVANKWTGFKRKPPGSGPSGSLSTPGIALIANEVQHGDVESLAVADHVAVLTGLHNVYDLLDMERKKASTLKDTVAALTAGLTLARKLSAAEAGIHPSASISLEGGAETIAAITGEDGGLSNVIDTYACAYGIDLMPAGQTVGERRARFGNEALQLELLRAIVAFCEAAPDAPGVLRATTTLLKYARDVDVPTMQCAYDAQVRCMTTIARTVALAKHLGLPEVQARFWDDFLVRGIGLPQHDANLRVVPHTLPGRKASTVKQEIGGNPLLYDPNARTIAVQSRQIFVCNDPQTCFLLLQNPLEVPVEVESIQLVTDKAPTLALETQDFRPVTLGARQLQQVYFSVVPSSTGDFEIAGALIKIATCGEMFFHFHSMTPVPVVDLSVKHQGQNALKAHEGTPGTELAHDTVAAKAVMPVPILELEYTSMPESSLMLLDGEQQNVNIVLRNTSSVLARLMWVEEDQECMQLTHPGTFLTERATSDTLDEDNNVVEPGETVVISCTVTGRTGVSSCSLDIHYCPHPLGPHNFTYGRILRLPFSITVQPSLRLANPRFVDIDRDHFELSFDATNAHSRPLGVRIELRHELARGEESDTVAPELEQLVVLSPAQSGRVHARVNRRSLGLGVKPETFARVWERVVQGVAVVWDEWAEGYASGRASFAALNVTYQQLEIAVGAVLRTDLHVDSGVATVGSFVRLRLTMQNRRGEASPPLLVKLDAAGYVGMPEQRVDAVAAGETHTLVFPVCPAEAGRVALTATVVPVNVLAPGAAAWMSRRVFEIVVV